jgi:hypothetical protein
MPPPLNLQPLRVVASAGEQIVSSTRKERQGRLRETRAPAAPAADSNLRWAA